MQSNGNVKKYLELNDKHVKDAKECLIKGNYTQASEKLWGATVTVAKAIAAQQKKTIKSHEGLHQNFYENIAPPDTKA